MERVTLTIEGMSCGHCVAAVKKALGSVDGAGAADVAIGKTTVEFDPARTSVAAIAKAVADAGYPVTSSTAA